MTDGTTTYLDINGDVRDTASLTLPSDRIFRDAWAYGDAEVVEVDMARAKEITKDNLRIERRPLLEALDVDYMKAMETGADVAAIVESKQALRDVTADPRIELANNPDQLSILHVEMMVA